MSKTDLVLEIMKFIPHEMEITLTGAKRAVSDSGDRLSQDILSQFPGMEVELGKTAAHCQKLSLGMAIDEIESFALELKRLGNTHKCEPLAAFAENLYTLALQFDMDQIKKALSDFNNLFNSPISK